MQRLMDSPEEHGLQDWVREASFLGILRPPLQRLFLVGIRLDLVTHPPQEIGGGFRGHDERLDHGRRDLPEDASHRSRDALLLMPTSCNIADGLGRVNNTLEENGKGGASGTRIGGGGAKESMEISSRYKKMQPRSDLPFNPNPKN